MIYAIAKNDNTVYGIADTYNMLYDSILSAGKNIDDYCFAEEAKMKFISRIVYVDGQCVYKNCDFWNQNFKEFLKNYNDHTVLDILGQTVDQQRFYAESCENLNQIQKIDGRPGQIDYNMEVGKEFVSLFREECILTKFTKESDTSPMIIFEKLTPVIAMLDAGAFREAKQYLAGYRANLKDDFLTDERIDKYIEMLSAADAIEYATDEDYFYVVPGEDTDDSAV